MEAGKFAGFYGCLTRIFIAFCEDRGWQDQDQEADGVEWEWSFEQGWLGTYHLSTEYAYGEYCWDVIPSSDSPVQKTVSGTAPTRAEARRQAVEAARGMG